MMDVEAGSSETLANAGHTSEDGESSEMSRGDFLRLLTVGAIASVTGSTLTSSAHGAETSASSPAPPTARYDLREFVHWIGETFEPTIKLSGGAGHYARQPGGPLELYGIADMACVLHTLGRLRPTDDERREWASAFENFQVVEGGWFLEKSPSHPPLHNLAFALGAMELLDLHPERPVVLGTEYEDIQRFLGSLDWKANVYKESHKGAGIAAARTLLRSMDAGWFAKYFAFCDGLLDPRNGMLGKDKPAGGDFDQIGGTFHYFFLYNHFNRRMAFPEQRIDAILGLQRADGHWDSSNRTWLTLDGIYLLTRTLRYAPHRVADVHLALHRVMGTLMQEMYAPAARKVAFGGKLPGHTLTCAVSILAELQQFFGCDVVVTEWPLKLVLDRRPFI